ncbi:hypothetical protein [Microbulbifer hydrolyticus]|uniref:Uncharacterized protein n=1 Tax=Microbulbifer hydrolyticus TaxID=48074 RepID=A0A6P1TCG8_9GAMM|nr:hypothetical protein [Microbulbifer hydrolyticus]MBB5210235.1 hypothetical protein [Microbulbifer hydrolyticus]QHQ39260.1 hypothetical protein GTQ55_09855 [Microbulbifer hydrolyticus]
MSGQQKFQIVSAGKTLRAKAPAEVLQQMATAFSITPEQARKLFLKGWVIKDHLSPGQVVQYRTQLQQIGLKIEVHPAGKFDNRAILARLQFAQKRKARKGSDKAAVSADIPVHAEVVNGSGVSGRQAAAKSVSPKNGRVANPGTLPESPGKTINTGAVKVPAAKTQQAEPQKAELREARPKQETVEEKAISAARTQLEALFDSEKSVRFGSGAQPLGLVPGLVSAALVPAVFVGLFCLTLFYLGTALWAIPASIIAGSFGVAVLVGLVFKLLVLSLLGVLFLYPFFTTTKPAFAGNSEAPSGIHLRKPEAPGLFLLLEVLEAKSGLGIAGKLAGPKNLAAAKQAKGTLVEVTPGAEILVAKSTDGKLKLQLGLAAVATLNGGDLTALIARAFSYHQGRLVRAAMYCSLVTAQKLQVMQDALENEVTLFSAKGAPAPLLKPLHKVLSACGLAIVPVVERLQNVHRATSAGLARRLEARADAAAAQMIGSDAFAEFAERWNQLVHADLVCGEINREAHLTGRRLANIPQAVRWLFRTLDEPTRASIEMAMAEDTDCWSAVEPAGHERVGVVEDLRLPALLERTDFSLQKLFTDFDDLCAKSSRQGIDESYRPVENQLLLTASKETEEAQQTLSEYFNRAIPRDFLPLQQPNNEELAELGLQESIDWLRSRLIDLQEQEQRLAQLQLRGTRIQLGAALVRANVRVDPRSYDLSGTTPSAAEASRKDNRARVQECMQQREQLHRMFFQRIHCAMASMSAADGSAASGALEQLKGFEALREPLAGLDSHGDLICELIERLPSADVPPALVQKYAQLAVQQIRQVHQAATKQPDLLPPALMEKLEACGAGEADISAGSRTSDLAGELQGLELRCKNASAVVHEGYQIALARLLRLCLTEETQRKIKPLRLVGAL